MRSRDGLTATITGVSDAVAKEASVGHELRSLVGLWQTEVDQQISGAAQPRAVWYVQLHTNNISIIVYN